MTEREAFDAWFLKKWRRSAMTAIRDFDEHQWLAWQASRQQALEEVALPCSYGGSSFGAWGDQKQGCTIRIHLTDAAEAKAWLDRLTGGKE